jgi:hypothetical protein
MTKALWESRFS